MNERDNYAFWGRVDALRGDANLVELASKIGLQHGSLKDMRSANRIPKTDATLRLALYLGTTVEYLMTGEAPASLPVTPEGMEDIVEALGCATLDERNMVRRLLNIREKGKSSSSREDEA